MRYKHCAQCGQILEKKLIENRYRQVCSNCGFINYENPLPVAAALVLNDKREVLLVKRKNDPRKNLWCLPMGFAELDETIASAALRELQEEAGIEGKIIRLLAVKNDFIEIYGNLLIVTFEVIKTGGFEMPGDDAVELNYFPVNNLPQVAFEPNLYAIKYCLEAHKEDWAIKDSFNSLEAGGKEMLSDRLVSFIRDNSDEVSARWLKSVTADETTQTYSKSSMKELTERVSKALSQFKRWLSGSEADAEIKAFYRKLGADRREMGFKLHEIISSLTILRREIQTYARDHSAWGNTIDLYTLAELDHRNYVFFDKAIYYAARGFEED